MSRLSIRLKLTLLFAGVMALVLAATGLFLYFRFRSELDGSIDQGLRSRADDLSVLIGRSDSTRLGSGRSTLLSSSERPAQILDPAGRVLDATPQARALTLVAPRQLRRAGDGPIFLSRGEHERLLATPVEAHGRRLVLVVGASLQGREKALESLAAVLSIGGPLVLLLASAGGYGLAAAALRPVESMRKRAATVSAAEPGARLPVPAARDEVRRLAETLNEMLARLEAAFARERVFVAEASHELRTPIAILRTELELALGRGRSAAELEAALRSAAEETDRLGQLAEDLLVIARSDQGALPVRSVEHEASELLARVCERFASRARESGRRILLDAAQGSRLLADRERLEQALGNLLDNAFRYGEGAIRLAALPGNGRVELHVMDEGPGFPLEFLPRAFERFSRADETRGRGGAGLGLAIVRAIAEAHGGEAHAANLPDGGADVWICVPAGPPTHALQSAC